MKAKERETTTHNRGLDGELGNILIISLIGNAGREEVKNDEGGLKVKRAVKK